MIIALKALIERGPKTVETAVLAAHTDPRGIEVFFWALG